ncbi:MAG: LytR/AlgR family response regulator transcription factor [Calditrichia bacterium]
MTTYTAIIVDDEQQARKGLQTLLRMDNSIELLASCGNGMEAIEQINQCQPQMILLDIQMPEVNGFDVLNSISQESMPLVIFTTAYDQYALRAFDVHAVDYLLKPFTNERFFEALNLAKTRIQQTDIETERQKLYTLLKNYSRDERQQNRGRFVEGVSELHTPDRITIKCDGRIHFISPGDIHYITAEDYYVQLHLPTRRFLVRDSIKSLLQRLPEQQFIRIHRSTAVNISKVQTITPHLNGDYYVEMNDGISLRGSRNYRSIFERIDTRPA